MKSWKKRYRRRMLIAGFRCSYRKIEVVTQRRDVVCGLDSIGKATGHKNIDLFVNWFRCRNALTLGCCSLMIVLVLYYYC